MRDFTGGFYAARRGLERSGAKDNRQYISRAEYENDNKSLCVY